MKIKLLYLAWWGVFGLAVMIAFLPPDFFERHYHINMALILIAMGVSLSFLKLLTIKGKTPIQIITEKFINKLTLTTLGLYGLLNILEKITYPNFIFSKLHLHLETLYIPVLLTLLFAGVHFKRNRKIFNKKFLSMAALTTIIIAIIANNIRIIFTIYSGQFMYMFKNLNNSYDQKMAYITGERFYYYAKFIKESTPPDSTILIPPMGFPWPQTGNGGYINYFLYPRKLVNGKEYDPNVDLKNIDWVLIDYGETETTQYGYTTGWPKFNVPASMIVIYDNGTVTTINKNYIYKDFAGKKAFGLIKVAKND